jgi:hypothetical protein
MKKVLLMLLIAVICFFAGYITGIKSKPVHKRLINPYKIPPIKMQRRTPDIPLTKTIKKVNYVPKPTENIPKKIPNVKINPKNIKK